MYVITKIKEAEGNLYPFHMDSIPFDVKRIFFVTDVPKNVTRGYHAHFETKQMLICMSGSIAVNTYDGHTKRHRILHAGNAILIDEMVWASQTYLTHDTTMLSLCSTEYDESDYIKSLDLFESLINNEI